MGLAFERAKQFFKLKQRGAGEANHLPSAVDEMDFGHAQRADHHDVAVIVTTVGRGAASEAGVCRLHDNDFVGSGTEIKNLPLLDKTSRADNSKNRTTTESNPRAVAPCLLRTSYNMFTADSGFKVFD